jgi:hypothetical protein
MRLITRNDVEAYLAQQRASFERQLLEHKAIPGTPLSSGDLEFIERCIEYLRQPAEGIIGQPWRK